MFRHQYNSNSSSHRIVELDGIGFLRRAGDWTLYTVPATFDIDNNVKLVVFTQYYDGVFESDRIYKITTLEKNLDGGSESRWNENKQEGIE